MDQVTYEQKWSTEQETHRTRQENRGIIIANDRERETEEVPAPEGLWTIESSKGLCIHSKIRKSAEKEIKQ